MTCPAGKWASEGSCMVGCGGNGLGMGSGGTYLGQEVMLGWLWLLRLLGLCCVVADGCKCARGSWDGGCWVGGVKGHIWGEM